MITNSFIHILIACSLATVASLWTTDVIHVWQYTSYLNDVDRLGPGKRQIALVRHKSFQLEFSMISAFR